MSSKTGSSTEKTIASFVSSPSMASGSTQVQSVKSNSSSSKKRFSQKQTKVSRELYKYYQKRKQQLEVDIMELKGKYKRLKKKQKESKKEIISESSLIYQKEEVKNRISEQRTQKISILINEFAEEKKKSSNFKNSIDLLNFQIEEERKKRSELADLFSRGDDIDISIDLSTNKEEKDFFSKNDRQKTCFDINDMLYDINHMYNDLIISAKPNLNSKMYQNAAKEFMNATNSQIRLFSISNASSVTENQVLKDRIDQTDREIKILEKQIEEMRENSLKAIETRRQELIESNEKNEAAKANWDNEIKTLDAQQKQLLKNIDSSAKIYDQINYEISEISSKYNELQLDFVDNQPFTCDFDFDDDYDAEEEDLECNDDSETIKYLLEKRKQTADELEAMKREKKSLKESYTKRETSIKEGLRKRIARIREMKQMILGEIPLDIDTDTESSGLLSLDMMSFTH